MKNVKLIVLSFCLLCSYFTFAQKQKEDPCAKYERIMSNIKRYDEQIAKYEKSSREEDKKSLDECKKIRSLIVAELPKLKAECDAAKLTKAIQNDEQIQAAVEQRYSIDQLTRDYYDHKIDWHTYVDKIFKGKFKHEEIKSAIRTLESNSIQKINEMKGCEDEQKNVIKHLKDTVYKMSGYDPRVDMVNIKPKADLPKNHFSEQISKHVFEKTGKHLSQQEKQAIQQEYNRASKQYVTLESQKSEAKKQYEENENAIDALCNGCPECCPR